MKDNDLLKARKRISENYCFYEIVENELCCELEDGRYLVFIFFPKGNTVDLLLRKYAIYTCNDNEKSIILSFSVDDRVHRDILNEWYEKRKKKN